MPRPFTGAAELQKAIEARDNAKTANELRTALAVLLPLQAGLNLEQTAKVLGRSKRATCSMRTHFCAVAQGKAQPRRGNKGLRNRAKNTLEEEAQALDKALDGAQEGAILVIPQFKQKIEALLGRSLSLSGVYRLLARHNWRKLAPDTKHPQGDAQAREEWKKTPPAFGRDFQQLYHRPPAQANVSR